MSEANDSSPRPPDGAVPARHALVCPACRFRYHPPHRTVGRRVRCRHCGHVWRDDTQTLDQVADSLQSASAAWARAGSSAAESAEFASSLGRIAGAARPERMASGEWIGKRLGKYEIKAVLGLGAMGLVYEAMDRDLDRTVALKILSRRVQRPNDSVGVQLFIEEARAAARLQHPNIVTIHEIGEEDGVHYFVMERVRGITMTRLVEERGPLPAGQACYILAHAAKALAAAHDQGIVHRDVKPGNIMIDAEGHARVTDFGLSGVERIDLTDAYRGKPIGTPGWLSPEVARGEPATPASDIYCLGLTLHYALTGHRLVRAETRSGLVRAQAAARSIAPESLPQSWPPRLRDIVVQCLQADPGDRYRTAGRLASDLLRALAPHPDDETLWLTDSPPGRTRSLPPGAWPLVVMALLAFGCGAAMWFLVR